MPPTTERKGKTVKVETLTTAAGPVGKWNFAPGKVMEVTEKEAEELCNCDPPAARLVKEGEEKKPAVPKGNIDDEDLE